MFRLKYSLCALLVLPASAGAQGSISSQQRAELKQNYEEQFAIAPSLMGLWQATGFAEISAAYLQEKGDFAHFQKHQEASNLHIKAESLYAPNEEGWAFYGQFGYQNGNSNQTLFNLDYQFPNQGSPNYFISKTPGDWHHQNYLIQGAASKTLFNESLHIGLGAIYKSDLHFRDTDVRNELYNLHMTFQASATWSILPNQALTLAGEFYRLKAQPEYSYKNQANQESYYLNMGLGSYLLFGAAEQLQRIDLRYGISLGWDGSWDNLNLFARYKLALGDENISFQQTSALNEQSSDMAWYAYNNHLIQGGARLNLGQDLIQLFIQANTISGKNHEMENEQGFIHHYDHALTQLDANLAYLRLHATGFRGARVGTNFFNNKELDLNYGQEFNFTNLMCSATSYWGMNAGKWNLGLELGGGYKTNLNLLHEIGAADQNFITNDIMVSRAAWESASSYYVNYNINAQVTLREKYALDFAFGGTYTKAAAIKLLDPNGHFSTKSDYTQFDTRVTFSF